MVILLNLFEVNPGATEQFEGAYKEAADFMRQQKGFIKTRLHRALDDSLRYFNYAEWETAEDFQAALASPVFQEIAQRVRQHASSTPRLYTVVYEGGPLSEEG